MRNGGMMTKTGDSMRWAQLGIWISNEIIHFHNMFLKFGGESYLQIEADFKSVLDKMVELEKQWPVNGENDWNPNCKDCDPDYPNCDSCMGA